MKRISIDLRLLPLRLNLLTLAKSHASEHGLSSRAAIKEVKSAAAMLAAADLDGRRHPSTQNPLIPAYKSRVNGALVIEFRCPTCNRIHSHGLPAGDGYPLQRRVSHCELDFGKLRGYRLLVVGWKRGDELPACSAAEIDALNGAICESGQ